MLIYRRSIHTIRKNTEALLIVSKEIGLEVNAEKTKYMIMSREQNAGQNKNIVIRNKSFETVEYNSINEEIKNRLISANACYYSVQT
jgi:hypothetical protein